MLRPAASLPKPGLSLSQQLRQMANLYAEFSDTGIQMAGPVARAHAQRFAELAEKASALESNRAPSPGLGDGDPPRPLPLHVRRGTT